MTQLKASTLKTQMKQEFSEIYNLCREILDKAVKPSLIKATLETLLRFVHWVPVGYIFETDLIETLRGKVRICTFSFQALLLMKLSLSL
jgi:exportin-1